MVAAGFEPRTLHKIAKRLEPPAEAEDPPYGLDTGTNILAPGVPWPCDQHTAEYFLIGVHEERAFNHFDHGTSDLRVVTLFSLIYLNFGQQHRANFSTRNQLGNQH